MDVKLRKVALENARKLFRRLPESVKTRIRGAVRGARIVPYHPPEKTHNPQLAEKDREISRLQARLAKIENYQSGIEPGNLIWILGHSRTGSTWLLSLMGRTNGYAAWSEPLIGDLFGRHYYRDHSRHHGRDSFVMADSYRETWTRSVRSFILDGANARFAAEEDARYIVIKEPNGSFGAPIIMEAVPESRMIFLIRDPRDVVASLLDAGRKESWQGKLGREKPLIERDPDRFVRQTSKAFLSRVERVMAAFDSHESPKTVVRYEDLRADTFETLKNIYAALNLPMNEEESKGLIERLAWENIPKEEKGEGKIKRKATPGGWREDLTPEQARIVEEETAPVIQKFYP